VILYGRHPVHEALRGPRTVKRIWATKNVAKYFREAHVTTAEEIESRAGTPQHQGVCADVSAYRYADPAALLAPEAPFLVALDELEDPQNLGAICRTAECAGVDGVVIPERRSAEVTPAVCRASAGAVEHLRIARVRNLADFLQEAKDVGTWVYGAAAEGRSYREVDLRGGKVLVIGAEGKGLRPRVAKTCDELVSIPLRGRIDSLNASAAAAILIYTSLD
jgi:23S rRNA (guanosine2251-2'-O)-methyltransferase